MKGRRALHALSGMIFLSLFVCTSQAAAAVWYVDNNALPGGNGLSWPTAFSAVQAGIDAAASGDEVWVKQGTYYENIVMGDGVALYGGFADNMSLRDQRNWNAFASILDGRMAGSVVTIDNCPSAATRVDGLTIQNGYAQIGGGVLCSSSSPTIANNLIRKNVAGMRGSGIAVRPGSSPVIMNNTITENGDYFGQEYGLDGGGIDISYTYPGKALVIRNVISRNKVRSGGAGISLAGDAEIANNLIVENTCNVCDGGGILGNDVWGARIHNNLVARNSAGGWGGGMVLYGTTPPADVANNTITYNSAGLGGGVGILDGVALANNIISFNSDGIYLFSGSLVGSSRNDVFGNVNGDYTGIGPGPTDISLDPLFVDTTVGDYHLRGGSPCIDAGDNSVVAAGATDIDGETRIMGGIVDIGADEVNADATPPAVVETAPADGQADVPLSQVITVTFSEDVVVVPPDSSIVLFNEKRLVRVDAALSVLGNVLTITPASLVKNTTYSVTIPAFSIEDLAGNRMSVDKIFYFTTVKR